MKSLTNAEWLNEPPRWSHADSGLHVVTGKGTDFWQNTFYGFVHDDGHLLHVAAEGDFTASIVFEGKYETLYDQAGLMLRADQRNWIKVGIEYSDNLCNFSLVCTVDGRSDWSVVPQTVPPVPQSVRITRIGDAAIAHYLTADGHWQLMRLCPFPTAPRLRVGPMTCSPQREGFEVTFTDFRIVAPIPNPLHG